MNRVRIVALAAASLGIAVAAGTLLQTEPRGGPTPVEGSSPPPAVSSSGETALAEIALAPPQVTGASLLPGLSGGAGDDIAAMPAPTPEPAAPQEQDLSLARLAEPQPPADDRSAPQADASAPIQTAANEVSGDDIRPMDMLADDIRVDGAHPADASVAEVDACDVWLVVTPEMGAMLHLSLFAPCDGDAVVTVTHEGLAFDETLADDGQLDFVLPALSADGAIEVTFADGRIARDQTAVADFAMHDRVAIQWQGPAALDLNAYEFGADFGAPGHVSPSSPSVPGGSANGFLIALGDPTLPVPRLAQVYSFPSGLSSALGEVELEIEASITEASCGRSLVVDTLESRAGNTLEVHTISLEMPECDGMGGFLVLKNLIPELTIALN